MDIRDMTDVEMADTARRSAIRNKLRDMALILQYRGRQYIAEVAAIPRDEQPAYLWDEVYRGVPDVLLLRDEDGYYLTAPDPVQDDWIWVGLGRSDPHTAAVAETGLEPVTSGL